MSGIVSGIVRGTLTGMTDQKVRENRLRRMAQRQGLELHRSRRRDPRALDYGTYWLTDAAGNPVAADPGTLDDVERWLTSPR